MKRLFSACSLLLVFALAPMAQGQLLPLAAWQRLTCSLPWGGSLVTGSSVTAYSNSSPASSCATVSQSRTCTGNTLSGSYTNQTCTNGCTGTPWGSVTSGYSATAYASSSVPCGSSCTSQTRTCTNGTLSGSYSNSSCNVAACASCSLPWGGSISHGNSVTAYSYNGTCGVCSSYSSTRTCNNGTLSGSGSYSSCSDTYGCGGGSCTPYTCSTDGSYGCGSPPGTPQCPYTWSFVGYAGPGGCTVGRTIWYSYSFGCAYP